MERLLEKFNVPEPAELPDEATLQASLYAEQIELLTDQIGRIEKELQPDSFPTPTPNYCSGSPASASSSASPSILRSTGSNGFPLSGSASAIVASYLGRTPQPESPPREGSQPEMVFDRRCGGLTRYLGCVTALTKQQKATSCCPSLTDPCTCLTRSFLMVFGSLAVNGHGARWRLRVHLRTRSAHRMLTWI